MDESLPSLLKHQKSTVSFKERTKCPKKKKGPWYIPSVTCIPIIVIVILIGETKLRSKFGFPFYRINHFLLTLNTWSCLVYFSGMVVMVPIILDNQKYIQKQREGRTKCTDTCHAILAESIPMNLTLVVPVFAWVIWLLRFDQHLLLLRYLSVDYTYRRTNLRGLASFIHYCKVDLPGKPWFDVLAQICRNSDKS